MKYLAGIEGLLSPSGQDFWIVYSGLNSGIPARWPTIHLRTYTIRESERLPNASPRLPAAGERRIPIVIDIRLDLDAVHAVDHGPRLRYAL